MSPYRRGSTFSLRVATVSGTVIRSTGTADRRTAKNMERMLEDLGPRGRREWDLLDAVVDGRITLGDLYDAHSGNRLGELRERLRDIDLAQYLDAWTAWVRAQRGDTGTAETYRMQVEKLVKSPFGSSDLSRQRVTEWLASLDVTPGTRRKNYYALRSFVAYLLDTGALTSDPLVGFKAPKNNAPRMRYLDLADILRLVEAQPDPFRALSAFIHATAAEITPALRVLRRDIDLDRMRAHIPGTKTHSRNRHEVLVSEWAKPYLVEHLRALHPNAPVFDGIDRWMAYDQHMAACKAVGVEDYTMHDARHSWAVRARKAAVDFEVIARQLGHKGITQVVTVYARFHPTEQDLAWRDVAPARADQRPVRELMAV
jgi:integrase